MAAIGGIGESKSADDNVIQICEQIREELEQKSGSKYDDFTAVSYKSQLVNGVNYFIKVRVSDSQHIHIRAHKAFDGNITLHSYQLNKTVDEQISYF